MGRKPLRGYGMPPWRREFELDVGRQEVGRRNLFKEEGSVYGSPKQEAMGPSRNLKPSTVRRQRNPVCHGARDISKGLVIEGSEMTVKELGFYPQNRWHVKGFNRDCVSPSV